LSKGIEPSAVGFVNDRFGALIPGSAQEKGLSQEDLALESGIDCSHVGGVERGIRNPSFKKLCQIAQLIDCDMGQLTAGLPLPHERF
jgi:transcriptional regulator with XRE-family HTH domain